MTDAAGCRDRAVAARLAELAAEAGQVLVEGVVVDLGALGPGRPDQFAAAHDAAGGRHERGQDAELGRWQVYGRARDIDRVPDGVQGEVSQGGAGRRGGSLERSA